MHRKGSPEGFGKGDMLQLFSAGIRLGHQAQGMLTLADPRF